MSRIRLVEQASAPDTPGTNEVIIYADSNGNLSFKRDTGSVFTLAGAGTITYYTGTWSPTITGSSSNPTVTYTAQTGRYSRIGDTIHYHIALTINTISGGSGDLQISVPETVGSTLCVATVQLSGVDIPSTPVSLYAIVSAASTILYIDAVQDNAAVARMAISALANGDTIRVTGFYFV